jgi:hypothetical protein
MTRSMNSVIFAVLRQSARIRYSSLRTVFLFVIMTVPLGAHASAATNEAEARALFTKFVAAQNAHSVSGVKAMLWNSPGTLLPREAPKSEGPGLSPIVLKNTIKAHGMSNPIGHYFM